MKILNEGHSYELKDLKANTHSNVLDFYQDLEINGISQPGTCNQEVIRALIDRVKFLNAQKEHALNGEIIYHLRKALILHEMRHLDRLVDKGENIEDITTCENGHFV